MKPAPEAMVEKAAASMAAKHSSTECSHCRRDCRDALQEAGVGELVHAVEELLAHTGISATPGGLVALLAVRAALDKALGR